MLPPSFGLFQKVGGGNLFWGGIPPHSPPLTGHWTCTSISCLRAPVTSQGDHSVFVKIKTKPPPHKGYGLIVFLTSFPAQLLGEVLVELLSLLPHPPDVLNTIGVKVPFSTWTTRELYDVFLEFSCQLYMLGIVLAALVGA